jgi:hypothetical protein
MGEGRGLYRVLVGKPEGKRPLGRPRHRWENNVKMDLQEVGFQFFQFQFISHSIDPLQVQRPHGYINSQDYNLLGPITNC